MRRRWIVALLIAAAVAGLIAVAISMNRCEAAGGVVESRFVGIIAKVPSYTYHCMLDGEEIQP